MLEHLSIKGYMSFKETEIALKRINVFVGANGAGKSNFVKLFNMLRLMLTNDFRSYVGKMGGADRFLYNGMKNTRRNRTLTMRV